MHVPGTAVPVPPQCAYNKRAPFSGRHARGNSALALEDKYDDIKKLIDVGKEKGYLTYNEVNDLIPHDVHSPDDLEDLLTTIGTQG
ncbi:MAG: RNA polymerase sigma factor region1.1 domain-containing protein, partial [Candidatus Korobacteraceae bacterium]